MNSSGITKDTKDTSDTENDLVDYPDQYIQEGIFYQFMGGNFLKDFEEFAESYEKMNIPNNASTSSLMPMPQPNLPPPVSGHSKGNAQALLNYSFFVKQQNADDENRQCIIIKVNSKITARKITERLTCGLGVLGTIGMLYQIRNKGKVIYATPYQNIQFDSSNNPDALVKLINQEYENQAQAKIITSNTDLTSEPSSKRKADEASEDEEPVANKTMCIEPVDLLHVTINADLKINANLISCENFVADVTRFRNRYYSYMKIDSKDYRETGTFTISCKKSDSSEKNLNVIEGTINDIALKRQIQITIDRPKSSIYQEDVTKFLAANRDLLGMIGAKSQRRQT